MLPREPFNQLLIPLAKMLGIEDRTAIGVGMKVAPLFHDILNANVLNRFRFFLRSSTSLIGKVVGREKVA